MCRNHPSSLAACSCVHHAHPKRSSECAPRRRRRKAGGHAIPLNTMLSIRCRSAVQCRPAERKPTCCVQTHRPTGETAQGAPLLLLPPPPSLPLPLPLLAVSAMHPRSNSSPARATKFWLNAYTHSSVVEFPAVGSPAPTPAPAPAPISEMIHFKASS